MKISFKKKWVSSNSCNMILNYKKSNGFLLLFALEQYFSVSPKSKYFFPCNQERKISFWVSQDQKSLSLSPKKKEKIFLSHMNKNLYCSSPKKISFPVFQVQKSLFPSPKNKNLHVSPITSQTSFPVSLEQKSLSLSHKKKKILSLSPKNKILFLCLPGRKKFFPCLPRMKISLENWKCYRDVKIVNMKFELKLADKKQQKQGYIVTEMWTKKMKEFPVEEDNV